MIIISPSIGCLFPGFDPIPGFWLVYIVTRPLGVSFGDLMSQPAQYGGLGLGTIITSAIFRSYFESCQIEFQACASQDRSWIAASSQHAGADDANPKIVTAGAYPFSDELGGFRVISASGIGTRDDPTVSVEELESADPATLTIRTIRPIQPFGSPGNYATGLLPSRSSPSTTVVIPGSNSSSSCSRF